MTLMKRYPMLRERRNLVDDFFETFLDSFNTMSNVNWSPSVDLEETKNDYIIHVELPGMNKKDIDISVENDVLTISGEKKERVQTKDSNCLISEIMSGHFSRSFRLPAQVDYDKIEAKWDNGVLVVKIPKSEIAKPKRIQIS
ncbi:MAG: Hsp20/alpha crystallin family protein [Candidatus Neomarinimicrobiota bacterium]|nr:Hsp20/alpha crystallin family protein [Candidatus Neomarinimicrobiota bacterium]RKY49422.1 MAG: Hsp20/alpha crystallin family protein [Candidatus Neomarinimicrobiota bacterium]